MIEILHIRYSLKLIKTSLVYSLRDSRNDKNVKRDEAMTSTRKHASNVIPTERSDEGSQKMRMIEILHIRYSLKLIKTSLVYSLRDSRNDKNVKRDEAMTSTRKHASNVIPSERSDEGSQ